MKNKIREKIIASVLLSAFALTNSMTASFAMSDYYGYGNAAPTIRTMIVIHLSHYVQVLRFLTLIRL